MVHVMQNIHCKKNWNYNKSLTNNMHTAKLPQMHLLIDLCSYNNEVKLYFMLF